jgi:cytochrome c oxidase subunit 2
MIDSHDVLGLIKIVYTIYLAIVFSMMALFVLVITRRKKVRPKFRIPFYGWIALLVVASVGIHVLTFNKIPWVKWDLSADAMAVDREFRIDIADYQIHLPSKQLLIREGETVRFNLGSADYTYGFGLFREDGTMVFQMQVVPGYENRLVWKFDRSGVYSIRSTEYSGPKGGNLLLKDAVIVATVPVPAQPYAPDESSSY